MQNLSLLQTLETHCLETNFNKTVQNYLHFHRNYKVVKGLNHSLGQKLTKDMKLIVKLKSSNYLKVHYKTFKTT